MDFNTLVNNLIMPIVFFGTVLAIVISCLYFRYKNRTAKYRLIEKMMEQGQTLPPEALESLSKSFGQSEKSPRSDFGSAIYQILIGVGLAVFFWALCAYTHAPYFLIAIGVFPFVIGLARLITIFYDKRPSN